MWIFLCSNKARLLSLLTDEDLEGCIDQINNCTRSTVFFIILFSEDTSSTMTVVIGAITWKKLWSSTSSAITHVVFVGSNKCMN